MKNILFSRLLLIILISIITFSVLSGKTKSSRDMMIELQGHSTSYPDRSKAEKLNKEGLAIHKIKNYSKSEQLFYEAAYEDPSWERPFFNLVCAAALQKKYSIAIQYLKMALNRNPDIVLKWAKNDSDLKGLRTQSSFKKVITEYEKIQNVGKHTYIGHWSGGQYSCASFYSNGTMSAATHCNYGISCKGKWKYNNKNKTIVING